MKINIDELENQFTLIGIQPHGHAGASLICGLFDNHPSILTIPQFASMAYYNNFWILHALERYREGKKEELIEGCIRYFQFLFDPENDTIEVFRLNNLGENENETSYISKSEFTKNLYSILEEKEIISRKTFLLSIYLAYNICLNRDVSKMRYLLFDIHANPQYQARWLTEDFPEFYIIYITREPIRNICSLIKPKIAKLFHRGSRGSCESILSNVLNGRTGYYLLNTPYILSIQPYGKITFFNVWSKAKNYAYESYIPEKKERSRMVRLDDLHKKPKETLSLLSSWLGLEWNDSLLKTTVNGKLWWNLAASIKITGFNTRILDQYRDQYWYFDQFRIHASIYKKCQIYGYEVPRYVCNPYFRFLVLPILILFPFKMEFKVLPMRLDIAFRYWHDNIPFYSLIRSLIFWFVSLWNDSGSREIEQRKLREQIFPREEKQEPDNRNKSQNSGKNIYSFLQKARDLVGSLSLRIEKFPILHTILKVLFGLYIVPRDYIMVRYELIYAMLKDEFRIDKVVPLLTEKDIEHVKVFQQSGEFRKANRPS